MPKDAVLVHYGRRNGYFQGKAKDLQDLQRAQVDVALFHFEGLLMDDKDTGERFQVHLGDTVIIHEEKKRSRADGGGTVVEELIGRVTEIFVTVTGERCVRLHWMYRAADTPLAAGPKESTDKEPYVAQLPSGDHLIHPRMLWVCGSEEDNDRYNNCFPLASIDRKVRVVYIKPGCRHPTEDPDFEGEFDDQNDWFCNAYTTRDYLTFEDCYEDWTLFGPHYKQLWQEKGVQGMQQLRQRCNGSLTSLMRGLNGKKLGFQSGEKRVLHVLELFAGGGGLSYICQSGDKVAIKHGWANDINNSAAASYSCNRPEAFTSCVGLEEYTQLAMKFGADVEKFCPNWQRISKLQQLRSEAPRRMFARTHIPLGVGVWGTTMGKPGTSADDHTAAAAAAEQALREKGRLPQQQQPAVEWDALCKELPKVSPVESSAHLSGKDFMPRPSELDDDDDEAAAAAAGRSAASKTKKSSKQRMKEAYEQASQQQMLRVDECIKFNKEHKRGKVLEVRDVTIKDCAVRVKHGSSRNQMEEGLTDWECWLEYEVRRERTGASSSSSSSEDSSSSEWAWEHHSLLWCRDAVLPMQRFMLRMLADKQIPMPGDVQLLTGGPPCQNVSGLNRHAKQQEVLNDPKNRLVTSYMNLIQYLQPNFILMEQVTDICKKESAMYARYALMLMVDSGYQGRMGICTAGHYGCSQGRRRAVFLGALSGKEQLPPFPAQTHHCLDFNQGYPKAADNCRVELPSSAKTAQEKTAARAALHPMTLLGDNLSDLPVVSNFEEGDRRQYASEPQSVSQAYLRRPPPTGERSLLDRSIFADAAMAPWQQMQSKAQGMLAEPDSEEKHAKILAVGQSLLCKNKRDVPLADLAGPSSQAAAAADDEDDDDGSAADAGDDGDDDADTAEDRAEFAAEWQISKNFANQTWREALMTGSDVKKREILHMLRGAELHNTQYVLGERKLHLLAAADQVDQQTALLRDHRPLLCNADDYGRMCAVPKEKAANFRDMPGVVTRACGKKGVCCSGSWHASQIVVDSKENKARLAANLAAWQGLSEEQQRKKGMAFLFKDVQTECGCSGGGMPPKPPKGWKGKDGNDKHFRVDMYGSTANGAWRGSRLEGCSSTTYWLNTGDLVCPRWCVTYKSGVSNGRHGGFGRVWYDQVQPTVVTRPEPHNLELVHPTQDRVLTIRENARCQGFPDHHVFVGLASSKGRNGSHGKGSATVDERYMQIGNAVAPPLAAALGRCLLLAATEDAPVGVPVVSVPDPEYEAVLEECKERGIGFWCQQQGNVVDQSKGNTFYWRRHLGNAYEEEEAPEAAAASTAAAAAAATGGNNAAKRKGSSGQQKRKPSASAAGTSTAAAAFSDVASGEAAAVDGKAAAAADDDESAPASKRKKSSSAAAGSGKAAAAASGAAAGSSKAAAAGSGRSKAAAAGAAAGSGKAAAAGSGRSSKRSAAAAATAAIKEGLQKEATPIKKLAQQAEAAAAKQGGIRGAAAAAAAAQLRQQQQDMQDDGPEDSPAAAADVAAVEAPEAGKSSARSSADLLSTDGAEQQQPPGSSSGEEDEEMDDADDGSADELVALPIAA